jgi:hypothetical protein
MYKTPKNDEFKSVNTEIVSSRPIDVFTLTLFIIVFQLVCFVQKCKESAMKFVSLMTVLNKSRVYSITLGKVSFTTTITCDGGRGSQLPPPPPSHTRCQSLSVGGRS